MKNIKLFKYKDTTKFEEFLGSYGYSLDDVVGFSLAERRQCRGNVLKWYKIYFNDDEYEYFKVVIFKDRNEYNQARLGFKGNKLFDWFEYADIRTHK